MQPMDKRSAAELVGTTIEIVRVFDAPRALVFQTWIDPHHIAQWFGPAGFTVPHCELDPRPGGKLLVHMQAPDGAIYPTNGIFEELDPPERLVITTTAFENDAGVPELVVRHTVTFAEHGGETRLTLHSSVVKASPEVAQALAGMEQGWSESFDKLENYLPSIQ
jgi:uncharacterized protein YndB with AHSA1/START domain